MKSVRMILLTAGVVMSAALLGQAGCEKKGEKPAKQSGSASGGAKHDDHDHAPGDGHDHGDEHDHGATTQLGEQAAGGFTMKASRDGEVKPGEDAAIDVWVSGGTAKITAVRFWIGTQDAKGSVKAKAELEKDNWHTHVEIPKPLPDGSKLWVEVETDKGEKAVAGFDLKN